MANTPKSFKELSESERDALMEFARLSEGQRKNMFRAGANVGWWNGLIDRAGSWKIVIAGVALFVGWITGFLDALAAAWQGVGK